MNSVEGKNEKKMVNINLIMTLLTNTDSPLARTTTNIITGANIKKTSL